jgi:hypothetical protein
MLTFLHVFVLVLDASHHVGVAASPVHFLLEFDAQVASVLAVFAAKHFCLPPLQFQLLPQQVYLLLQSHVFFQKLLCFFVYVSSGVAGIDLLSQPQANFGYGFALASATENSSVEIFDELYFVVTCGVTRGGADAILGRLGTGGSLPFAFLV